MNATKRTEWVEERIGDVAELFGGSTPSSTDPTLWGGDIPWLVPSDITALQECTVTLTDTPTKITQRGYDSCATKMLPPGTVCVSSRATVGDCIILGREACTNQGFVNVICTEKLDPRFFLYWVRQNKRVFLRLAAGTTFDEIGRRSFRNIYFARPKDVSEQQAIGAALQLLDTHIIATQAAIAAAERLQRGLMRELFSGRLKPDGSERTANEFWPHRKLGMIPNGWIVDKGAKLADKITKGQSPKWQGFDYAKEGMLFVTSENVRDGFLDVSEPKFLPVEFNQKIRGSELRKGDILINLVGASIGRSCLFDADFTPANINQAVCLFRPRSGIVSRFLLYMFQLRETVHRLMSSQVETARANLSLGDVRQLLLAIPESEDEQRAIADRLDAFHHLIHAKQAKIVGLKRLKKSLMQNLLTGRMRLSAETIAALSASSGDEKSGGA